MCIYDKLMMLGDVKKFAGTTFFANIGTHIEHIREVKIKLNYTLKFQPKYNERIL